MDSLRYVVLFLLWTCCTSQKVCEEPPEVDFGDIIMDEITNYGEYRVQYRCIHGYALVGSEWITCKGQKWTAPPKCLEPCVIRKKQLDAKHLLLRHGRSHSHVVQHNSTLEFLCREGYVVSTPSVRKCVDGHMDLPSCISERGRSCSHSPTIENGYMITLYQKQYTSGSSVEFRCQGSYAMEGYSRSFCDNGNWTKLPVCLEPCKISLAELENWNLEVKSERKGSDNVYVRRGDSAELACKPGYDPATSSSKSAFVIQCNGKPIVYPECKEIVCLPPKVPNGKVRPMLSQYRLDEPIQVQCDARYRSRVPISKCTESGWSPPPLCKHVDGKCLPPPPIENGDIVNTPKAEYLPGEFVQYQCQNFYRMEGSPMVTCNNGEWSAEPRCLVPCTASEEDMGRNNIQLRWLYDKKLYSEFGDTIEFTCIHGFHPAQGSPPFRAQCRDGTITYPRCE